MNALSRLELLTPESPRWDEFADRLAYVALPCDHSFRHAKQIMADMGNIDIPASVRFFEEHGGYCDCEIMLNVDPACRVF